MSYEELILYVSSLAINTEITVERNGIYEKPIWSIHLEVISKVSENLIFWDRILE